MNNEHYFSIFEAIYNTSDIRQAKIIALEEMKRISIETFDSKVKELAQPEQLN